MRFIQYLFLALVLSWTNVALADDAKLKVGFIAPLSGPVQAYGDAVRNGFELALSEMDKGLIDVVYEDDQFTPSKTVSVFNKLLTTQDVDVVICVGSATCNAIAPIAESKKMPLIGWASDPKSSLGRRYVIRSYPSGEAEGRATGLEAIKRRFSKTAVLSSIHDYPISWRRGVLEALPAESIILDEEVPPDLLDFRALLSKAKRKGVESFVVCLLPGQGAALAKQAQELGIKAKIGGCIFLEDENEAKLADGALSGAWYITVPISKEFTKKYVAKYGNQNTICGAVIHYDLVKLLEVLIKNNTISDISKDLMDIKRLEGAAGTLTLDNDNGDKFFKYELVAKEVGVN